MPKKQKTAPKAVAKKAVKTAKVDYAIKATATILTIWGVILVAVVIFNALGLAQKTGAVTTQVQLVNLFTTILITLIAFITFKTVKAIMDLDDDGYLAAIVILLNAGLVGYNGFSASIQFNGGYFWPVLILAFLGLMFLLPQSFMFKKANEHNLTTWTLILHILLWFSTVVLMALAQNAH